MNKKIVTIEIAEDGTASIDLAGFAGKGCAKIAAEFRGPDMLIKSTNKREFNIEEKQQVKEQQ